MHIVLYSYNQEPSILKIVLVIVEAPTLLVSVAVPYVFVTETTESTRD